MQCIFLTHHLSLQTDPVFSRCDFIHIFITSQKDESSSSPWKRTLNQSACFLCSVTPPNVSSATTAKMLWVSFTGTSILGVSSQVKEREG